METSFLPDDVIVSKTWTKTVWISEMNALSDLYAKNIQKSKKFIAIESMLIESKHGSYIHPWECLLYWFFGSSAITGGRV